MKHTLPALIEDLQSFQTKLADDDFLVAMAESATNEQRLQLIYWVYQQYAPPELRLDPDTLMVEVRPLNEDTVVYSAPLKSLEKEAFDELDEDSAMLSPLYARVNL